MLVTFLPRLDSRMMEPMESWLWAPFHVVWREQRTQAARLTVVKHLRGNNGRPVERAGHVEPREISHGSLLTFDESDK